MKQYYYLVSSLYDLILDSGKKVVSIRDFLEFCREELTERDYFELKKLFLFNDIKNAVSYKKIGDKYLTPAFYDEEEFLENLKDIDSFLPFLNDFYYNINNNKKNDSNLDEIDDLTLLFYENLDVITNKFIKEYKSFLDVDPWSSGYLSKETADDISLTQTRSVCIKMLAFSVSRGSPVRMPATLGERTRNEIKFLISAQKTNRCLFSCAQEPPSVMPPVYSEPQ